MYGYRFTPTTEADQWWMTLCHVGAQRPSVPTYPCTHSSSTASTGILQGLGQVTISRITKIAAHPSSGSLGPPSAGDVHAASRRPSETAADSDRKRGPATRQRAGPLEGCLT